MGAGTHSGAVFLMPSQNLEALKAGRRQLDLAKRMSEPMMGSVVYAVDGWTSWIGEPKYDTQPQKEPGSSYLNVI